MPRFIVERTLEAITPETVEQIGQLSNRALADADNGVVWIRNYVSEAEGKLYCEYDAPSAEAVLELSRRAGMPVDRISEISVEINPDMFR